MIDGKCLSIQTEQPTAPPTLLAIRYFLLQTNIKPEKASVDDTKLLPVQSVGNIRALAVLTIPNLSNDCDNHCFRKMITCLLPPHTLLNIMTRVSFI
jgi:hypothetical protein